MEDDRFESEFQYWFKRRQDVGYQPVLREDVEREYAQLGRHDKRLCPHGKTVLTCSDCYFNRR